MKINFWLKLWYGAGNSGNAVKTVVFSSFLFFYYNQVLGLSASMCGLSLFVALIFDAINDPLIGIWSDRWQSKWGRRHPFMAVSALPFSFFLFCLFIPPDSLGETALFIWFTVFAILTRTAQTFFQIPYLSLGAELSDDYKQRSTIYSFGQFFGFMGSFLVAGSGYLYFFKSTPTLKNGMLNEPMYLPFALFAAFIILITSFVCVVGTRSVIPNLKKQKPSTRRITLKTYYREFYLIFRNQSFQAVFIGLCLLLIVNGAAESLANYVFIHFWGLTPEKIAFYLALPFFAGVVVALFLATKMIDWFDKKGTLIVSVIGMMLTFTFLIGGRLLDILPPNESPELITLIMFGVFFTNTFAPVFFITVNSIFSDIADEIELETSQRKEGVLFSVRALLSKAATGLGGLVAGLLLDLIHFPTGAKMGEVPESIVFNLGLVAGPLLAFIGIIALFSFSKYRLNKYRFLEIKQLIEFNKNQEE